MRSGTGDKEEASALFFLRIIHAQVKRAADTAAAPPDFEENLVALGLVAELDGRIGVGHGLWVFLLYHIAPRKAGLGGV